MRLGRVVIASAVAGGLAAGTAPDASAGAWTQPEGKGQVIVSGSLGVAPPAGLATTSGDTQSSFTSLFFEYGLLEGLTVGGTTFVEIPEGDGDSTANVGVLVRKRLWRRDAGDVASVQVGYVHPLDGVFGSGYGGDGADPTHELSLRSLYGRGFWGDWGNAFVSLEGGYHLQLDGDDDEVRADATVGYSEGDGWLYLLSLYTTFPVGEDEDENGRSVKLASSLAYTFDKAEGEEGEEAGPAGFSLRPVTVQFGVSQDLLNFGDGFGVQLSVWKSF